MSNDLKDYIEYRLSRADSTLKDVKILGVLEYFVNNSNSSVLKFN
jgi:hypothetical protein